MIKYIIMSPDPRRFRFALAITCLDGRVQRPVVEYLRRKYNVDYVDLITEPGPERALTEPTRARTQAAIHRNARFSRDGHDAEIIAVTAHDECLGNDAESEVRLAQLRAAQQVVIGWNLGADVVALWVHGNGQVEEAMTAVPSPRQARPTAVSAPVQTFGRVLDQPKGPAASQPDNDDQVITGIVGFALGIAAERKRNEST